MNILLITALYLLLNYIIYRKYVYIDYYLFSPFFFFSIINYVIYVLAPVLIENILNKSILNLELIQFIVLTNLILTFTYLLFSRTNYRAIKETNLQRVNYYDTFYPLFVLILPILLLLFLNLIKYGISDFNILYKESRRGGNAWKMIIGYLVIYIPFIYLYAKNKLNFKFYILLFLALCCVILTGSRIIFIEAILFYLLYYVYSFKIKFKLFFTIMIAGLSLVILMTIVRMLGSGSQDISNNLVGEILVFLALSLDMPIHFDKVINYIDLNGIIAGRTLIDFVYYFMPSSLFPGKPLSSEAARTIYSYAEETGIGYNFGIFAISYLNFGVIGSILLPFLYFCFFNSIYKKFLYLRLKNYPHILDFIYIYLSVKIVIGLRLGIMTHFLGLVTIQLVFIILVYLYIHLYIKLFRPNVYISN